MTSGPFGKSPVYILAAARTPVGSPLKTLKDFSIGDLSAIVARDLVKRAGLNSGNIRELIMGNTVSAGTGQNPARQAAIKAGLPASTTAYTVNNVCGAGLQSVILAGQSVVLDPTSCIMALGAESASRTPLMFSKLEETPFDGRKPSDSLIEDGLRCAIKGKMMGELCEKLAYEEKISRETQDIYALESHRKAAAASFESEIIFVPLADGKNFSADERIRRRLSAENFSTLPPAFVKGGTVTSGNSSVPSDGAAGVVVAGDDFMKGQNLKPMARISGFASIALEPDQVFRAAVPAARDCLSACGLKLKDIDLFEVSEAFSAQAIYTRNALKIPPEEMNIKGGDIALGHPLGAAGTRILVTLVHALKENKKRYGLAVICYGGGGAIAAIVENII